MEDIGLKRMDIVENVLIDKIAVSFATIIRNTFVERLRLEERLNSYKENAKINKCIDDPSVQSFIKEQEVNINGNKNKVRTEVLNYNKLMNEIFQN